MALSISQTRALASIIKPGMKIASMGYPDVIVPLDKLVGLFSLSFSIGDDLQIREDSEAICKRHGLPQRPIPDAHSLFRLLNCELDVYDIVKERGCEILCDLNEPMESALTYDIVLDVGTVEHCFNIAQAMMNMAGLVKEDGYIIHENPFNWGNHGFYNLNPTFFADFYEANGFELIACVLATKDGQTANVSLTSRFKFTDGEVNIFTMARRAKIQPFIYPIQTKYKPAAEARADPKEATNG